MTRISQLYLYINRFLLFLFNIFSDALFDTYLTYKIWLMIFLCYSPITICNLVIFNFYHSYMPFTASFESVSSIYINICFNVTFSQLGYQPTYSIVYICFIQPLRSIFSTYTFINLFYTSWAYICFLQPLGVCLYHIY